MSIIKPIVLVALVSGLFISAAAAAPMTFRKAGSDVRFCPQRCDFIQATGDIVSSTPADFEKFLKENEFHAGLVRLNSSGGSLHAGLALGMLFRKNNIWTEVGADEPDPSGKNFDGTPWTRRVRGSCASACAYAFLGGVGRELLEGDRLGVHRFYQRRALDQPDEKFFTGRDLDEEQRTVSKIALFMASMGVDAGLLTLADEAGPKEMRWLSVDEAERYRASYSPGAWKPWRIETFRGGVLAISETVSGKTRMVASCSKKRGPQLTLSSQSESAGEWFQQCKDEGPHPVLGEVVPNDKVEVLPLPGGGGTIRFRLPTANPKLTRSGLFEHSTAYSTACSAMGWGGSSQNMAAAVRTALKNCFTD